eukprot:363085-Pyramimonas_sp.AAC.1
MRGVHRDVDGCYHHRLVDLKLVVSQLGHGAVAVVAVPRREVHHPRRTLSWRPSHPPILGLHERRICKDCPRAAKWEHVDWWRRWLTTP